MAVRMEVLRSSDLAPRSLESCEEDVGYKSALRISAGGYGEFKAGFGVIW